MESREYGGGQIEEPRQQIFNQLQNQNAANNINRQNATKPKRFFSKHEDRYIQNSINLSLNQLNNSNNLNNSNLNNSNNNINNNSINQSKNTQIQYNNKLNLQINNNNNSFQKQNKNSFQKHQLEKLNNKDSVIQDKRIRNGQKYIQERMQQNISHPNIQNGSINQSSNNQVNSSQPINIEAQNKPSSKNQKRLININQKNTLKMNNFLDFDKINKSYKQESANLTSRSDKENSSKQRFQQLEGGTVSNKNSNTRQNGLFMTNKGYKKLYSQIQAPKTADQQTPKQQFQQAYNGNQDINIAQNYSVSPSKANQKRNSVSNHSNNSKNQIAQNISDKDNSNSNSNNLMSKYITKVERPNHDQAQQQQMQDIMGAQLNNNKDNRRSSSSSQKQSSFLKFRFYLSSVEEAYKPPFKQDYFSNLYREHFVQTCQGLQYGKMSKPVDKNFIKNNKIKLGPNTSKSGKTILFDLDETLVHCNDNPNSKADEFIDITFPNGETIRAGVNVRPLCQQLLEDLYEDFEIIVFTASHSCYANKIIDYIDPQKKYIKHRMYRNHCVVTQQGIFIKDLKIIEDRNLSDIVLVDNAGYSFSQQPSNGIPILAYYDNKQDIEFQLLKPYLQSLANEKDVRIRNIKEFQLNLFSDQQGPKKVYERLFLNK